MSRRVPEGWVELGLGDVVQTHRGLTWKKDQERTEPEAGARPVIGIANIQSTLDLSKVLYLSGISDDLAQQYVARKGWTIMVGSNGNPARVGNSVFIGSDGEFLFGSFCVGLSPKGSRLRPEFLHRLMCGPRIQGLISSGVQGTTGLNNVNLPELRAAPVLIPPLAEQEKIAEILGSIDAAIAATRRVIEQTRSLKRALMQELLIRGIPGRHTHFKDSPLGKIPECWSISSLDELGDGDRPSIRSGPFGSTLKTKHFTTHGVPVLTIASLGEGSITNDELFFTSRETADSLSEYAVRPGDLVFSRVADVGRSAVIRAHQSGWIISGNLMRICLDRTRVDADFAYASITQSPLVKRQIRDATADAGRTIVTSDVMKRIRIPLPPRPEQKRVVDLMQALDLRQRAGARRVSALDALKQVILAGLLSGELHVPLGPEPEPLERT